jgi:hypothetical protein
VGWALLPHCGTIANCIAAYFCLDVNSNGAEFLVSRDLQLLAGTVHRFWILDFGFLIEELSSRLNPGVATRIVCGRSGEVILARLKNFDFQGTIGET